MERIAALAREDSARRRGAKAGPRRERGGGPARVAKADLASEMVYEFPDVAGG